MQLPALSFKSVSLEDIIEWVNRELLPFLKAIRKSSVDIDDIVQAISDSNTENDIYNGQIVSFTPPSDALSFAYAVPHSLGKPYTGAVCIAKHVDDNYIYCVINNPVVLDGHDESTSEYFFIQSMNDVVFSQTTVWLVF